MTSAVVIGLILVVGWVLLSRRFDRWSITAPITLLIAGYLVARVGHLDVVLEGAQLRALAEVALVLVLFRDASSVTRSQLRSEAWLPVRLLAVGLPLTIASGAAVAWLLFPGENWWVLALLAAVLAPTDAALGESFVSDQRIPSRLRTLINVESGLNDGLATPFVLFFLAGAAADQEAGSISHAMADALVEVVVAVAVGGLVGGIGARALLAARRLGWSQPSLDPIAVLALALLTYFLAIQLGGNGFVAAFIGGLSFGLAAREQERDGLVLTQQAGTLLGLAVWLAFGLTASLVLPSVTWRSVVYAVLSLTVIRIVPVLFSLAGSGLGFRDSLVVGWLGPRGLASIVFALLAAEALTGSDEQLILTTVTVAVTLSVVAHGLSAGWIASRYGRLTDAEQPAASHPVDG